MLLSDLAVDVNAVDKAGDTVLMAAVKKGNG